MIKPIVAGQFYSADFGELTKEIEDSFNSRLGPGTLPMKRTDKKLFGVIAPHAGYMASGACAAWVYKEIAESKFAKTYIILAPDHNGHHRKITTSTENWETPLGIIKSDTDFIRHLLEKCDFIETADTIQEHSIEVQLPFLQYSCRDKLKELKIVPIIVPSEANYEKLGAAIAELGEDCCVIGSSDFTHYGPRFGYVPFTIGPKPRLEKLDGKAIKLIEQLNARKFLQYVKATKATICGEYAIAAAIEAVKEMFAKKGRLLSYYTSGDLDKDYTNSVSYAAIEFR